MIGSAMFEDIGAEFRGAALGDERRSVRLERIGAALSRDPASSFPEAMESEGQLEALYRFLNNDAVTISGILQPHTTMTSSRCNELKDVLVLQDTTAFEFSGTRRGLGRLHSSSARLGFLLHASLAIITARDALGVLAAETWVRRGQPRGRANKRGLRRDPGRESLRWVRGVVSAEDALSRPGRAVHVMDREGDNDDLFSYLHANSIRHVIRLANNRNLVGTSDKLKDRARAAHYVFYRDVHLSPRAKMRELDRKGIHPPRNSRTARLAVSATAVEIRRSNNHSPGVPASLAVNVVTVSEKGCPRGGHPVAWFLVTTEPIQTRSQVESIVDAYRARWVIEEFFKALKSGCRFEHRQLESYKVIEAALGLFMPIALRLLALRGATRSDPKGPCRTLTAQQLAILRAQTTRRMSAVPTNEEATMALGELGGHLRSNGAPGWALLGRAMERLLVMEIGWNMHRIVIDDEPCPDGYGWAR